MQSEEERQEQGLRGRGRPREGEDTPCRKRGAGPGLASCARRPGSDWHANQAPRRTARRSTKTWKSARRPSGELRVRAEESTHRLEQVGGAGIVTQQRQDRSSEVVVQKVILVPDREELFGAGRVGGEPVSSPSVPRKGCAGSLTDLSKSVMSRCKRLCAAG